MEKSFKIASIFIHNGEEGQQLGVVSTGGIILIFRGDQEIYLHEAPL